MKKQQSKINSNGVLPNQIRFEELERYTVTRNGDIKSLIHKLHSTGCSEVRL